MSETTEELKKIRVAIETERNFRTGEVTELRRVADAMEEILRLVKKDMEKYEEKKSKK
jgi:hypothetical protein